MSSNLEAALKISIAQTGLENLTALIGELKAAGVATDAFEKDAAELGEELKRLGTESGMVEAFKALKLETQATEKALASAQERVKASAAAFREKKAALEQATAAERAASDALGKARDLQASYQAAIAGAANELKFLKTRAAEAGAGAAQYATQIDAAQRKLAGLKKESSDAAKAVRLLSTDYKPLGAALKDAAGEAARAERAFTKNRQEASRAKDAFDASREALHRSRQAMQAAGIAAGDLAAHQSRLRKTQDDLARRGEALTQQLRSSAEAAKVNAAAAERASKAWALFRTGVGAGLGFAAAQIGVTGLTGAINKLREGVVAVATVGGQFEALRVQLQTLYGSAEKAETAFAWIKRFTTETPFELDQVTEGFIKLKAMGLDPMDGTFQAIADQASALGASGETLNGIVLALGQAWSKQKLQGEEALQLIERGVPVWDLMSRATGKTAAELQDLSAKGLLGRDAIRALVEEMGRMNAGAAERAMQTLNGQIANLKDNWTNFLNTIAESGALEYFSNEVKAINAAVKEMAETGELKVWAKEAADAIKSIGEAIKSGVLFVADYGDALITLGQIAIGLKALNIGKTMLGWGADALTAAGMVRSAMGGMAGAATGAAAGVSTLGKVMRGTLAVAAAAGVVEIVDLVSNLIGLYEQTQKLKEAEDSLAETQGKLAARYRELSDRTGVAVSNTDEFNAAVAAGKLVFDEASNSWVAGGVALEKVTKSARELDDELIRADAAKLVAQFDEIIKKGGDVESALKGIAEGLKFGQANGVSAFTQALAELESRGTISAKNVGEAWRLALAKLSTGEVNAFALIVQQAFEDNKISAEQFAQINNEVLGASFKRLGIDGEVALGRVGAGAQDAINAVDRIVESLDIAKVGAQQSAIAIELALTKAFSAADSQPALDQLNQRMAELAKQGKLGADAMSRLGAAAAEARARVDEMTPGVQSVEEAFRELGITSKTALTEAARAAREAYDIIANSGKAGPREIAEAWLEYAKRAIAANEGVASASLKAEAAALGQEAALKKLIAAANPLSENMKAIAEAMDATVKAAEKSTQVTERKAAADLRAAEVTLELARAKGDEAEITKAQIALAETQLQGSRRIASAKEAEASAADKKVAALKKEAQADGEVSDAEKEAIATAEEAAAAKRDTAEASREKADADEAELQKVRELAEGQKEATKAVAEAVDGTAVDLEKGLSVPWLTGAAAASQYADEAIEAAKRAAAALSVDVNPYEFLERYARGYIRTLEDIDKRQNALNSTAGDGVEDLRLQLLRLEGTKEQIDAAEKARDLAKVERNIELMRLEIQRARVRGDDAEVTRLEAEIRLMNEQLVLIDKIHKAEARQREGKSTKSGGGAGMSGGGGAEVPVPGVRPQVNIVVNNTIEGLLDVQDRGSLDQLGRRLAPIWADLQRRGAF